MIVFHLDARGLKLNEGKELARDGNQMGFLQVPAHHCPENPNAQHSDSGSRKERPLRLRVAAVALLAHIRGPFGHAASKGCSGW